MLDIVFKVDNKERLLFKRHFLKGVILELAFESAIKDNFANNNYNEYFDNKGYTNTTVINNMDFKITIDNNQPTTEQTNDIIGYSYINLLNNNEIQIINNRFIFVQNTYIEFNVFLEEIKYFINNILNKFPIKIIKMGFRKINSIVVSDMKCYADITELFNENLFGFLRTTIFDYDLLENYRDNFTLKKNNTRYIINTSCSKVINIPNSYEVNIDNDIILEEIVDNGKLVDIISDINQVHYNLFCWVTSDKMKSIMNEE